MESLWGQFTHFENERKPEDVLKEQFNILEELTNGVVIGRVERFDQTLEELSSSSFVAALNSLQHTMTPSVQETLGENDDVGAITYEAFVTTRAIPNYKYRFLIMQHGLVPYPTSIAIERAIATEMGSQSYLLGAENETEFVKLIGDILKTKRVMNIVSRLSSYSCDND